MSMMVQSGRFGVDPHWASVVFLLQPAGPDTSTAFVDKARAKAITPQGNAQMATAVTKFSPASLKTDGTGDSIRCADSADWTFGQLFTVECFIRMTAAPGNMAIMGQWGASAPNAAWFLYVEGGDLKFRFQNAAGTIRDTVYTWSSRATGVWYHVAATRDASDVVRIFIDGTQVASQTWSDAMKDGTGNFSVGDLPGFGGYDSNCHFDQVRITKGVCRYTANFVPPTAAFPSG